MNTYIKRGMSMLNNTKWNPDMVEKRATSTAKEIMKEYKYLLKKKEIQKGIQTTVQFADSDTTAPSNGGPSDTAAPSNDGPSDTAPPDTAGLSDTADKASSTSTRRPKSTRQTHAMSDSIRGHFTRSTASGRPTDSGQNDSSGTRGDSNIRGSSGLSRDVEEEATKDGVAEEEETTRRDERAEEEEATKDEEVEEEATKQDGAEEGDIDEDVEDEEELIEEDYDAGGEDDD